MPESQGDITALLTEVQAGNRDAESKLVPLVYDELRRLAGRYMRRERPDHTLQPTALVHEAYLRLIGQRNVQWQNRSHFFGVAARMMRRILVDHARTKKAEKRGGNEARIPLNESLAFTAEKSAELLALDEALTRLSQRDPRQGQVVELRFFGGLSEEETAAVLGISTRTVKRDWTVARAWLYKEISKRTD
jgi:RNA polymerase sigma-70 factor, ECF subfamily